ncbi:nuclear transcription factor Y subunit B-6-like [Andrographis paniculata]|uniref:nuclear transcription factor Y subunit B-6-like n=1 Tax=Andrographis paniculata TaxID=175694 RepID=UPI0021E79216|nr:nuclear transcription factor Y subunit B-6-like [Andrographis paniculata]
MNSILPPHSKIAYNAKEAIQECISELISYMTVEANAKCHQDCRRIITAEDVSDGLSSLNFTNYIGPLSLYLDRYRSSTSCSSSQFPYTAPLPLPINFSAGPLQIPGTDEYDRGEEDVEEKQG